MKTYKKIGFGLSVIAALTVFLLGGRQALAAPVNDDSFRDATYTISAFDLKSNHPKTIDAKIAGTSFTFTDSNPGDSKLNFKTSFGGSITTFICGQGDNSDGITLEGSSKPLPGGGNYYSGYITVAYKNDTNKDCNNNVDFDGKVDHLTIAAVYGVPGITVGGGSTTAASDDDSSACAFNSHTSLEWFACPIITSLSKTVDLVVGLVEDQLQFNNDKYLSNASDSSHSQVKKAWSLVKTIVSAALVIVMLVMIISQAAGGGVFEAYTIRKMLPRLVVAVIAMQLSWELCRFAIQLANDAGNGIRQIMTAPFGGPGNLDLPSILHHLNPAWAFGTTVAFAGLVIAVISLSEFILPVLLLMVFTVMMSVLVALATLLFRNILIVLLVIFSPLAILAWVFPGQSMQRYWKLWSDNFVKLLLLFPMVVALVYSGRIVAWIAGGIGQPGFLDFCIVVVAFFGPLFFLPKVFKWGGAALSAASTAISSNGLIRKGREVGMREIFSGEDSLFQQRSGKAAAGYNPFDRKLRVDNERSKLFLPNKGFLPSKLRGKPLIPVLAGRGLVRAKSGHILPTDRSRALTQRKGAEYKSRRKAEQGAFVDREYEVGDKEGFKGRFWTWDKVGEDATGKPMYGWKPDDNLDEVTGLPKTGVGSGKRAVMRSMLHKNDRERTAAMEKFFNTSSAIEGQGSGVSLNPDSWSDGTVDSKEIQDYVRGDLRAYLEREYGLGNLEVDVEGNPIARMHMLPEFEKIQENDPQFWGKLGRGDWLPPVTQARYTNDRLDSLNIGVKRDNQGNIIERDPTVREPLLGKRLRDNDRIAYAIDGSYITPSNITSQPQGLFQDIARVNDPKVSAKFANLLAAVSQGGPATMDKLVNLTGGVGTSLYEDVNRALERDLNVSLEDYMSAARNGGIGAPTFDIKSGVAVRQEGPSGGGGDTGSSRGNEGGFDGGGGPQTSGGGGPQTSGGGGPQTSGGGGGPIASPAPGVSTAPGNAYFGPVGSQSIPASPVELKIDHDALADTMREATRLGAKQGFSQAIRDSGLTQPGETIQPNIQPEAPNQNSPEDNQPSS
jgi:hypothetical protein